MIVMIKHITKHNGRFFQPGRKAQGGEVWLHDEIAVTLVPARRFIARNRLHIDVIGQKIIAAMRFIMRGFHKEARVEAFANQAALHVYKTCKNRINFIIRNGFF